MVHSTRSVLVTLGLWAASSCAAALADGTVTPPRGECHRPFPAFLWAGSQAGEQQQVGYHHAATDAHDVATVLVDAASAEKGVELVVVVLSKDPSFSTAGVSEAHAALEAEGVAKPCMHAKSATATFPYTYPSATSLSVAVPLLAEATGAVVQEVALQDVVSTATETGLLSDGKLDFIVATVPETGTIRETDSALMGVITSLEQESKGSFLLMWTGDFHGEGCGRRSLAAVRASARRLQTTEASYRTIKMTPDILSGVLVLLLFLFIISAGLGCIGAIECPQSFNSVKPAMGREY